MMQQKQKKQQQTHNEAERLTLFEREARAKGFLHIAGIDEAGRGPLAGPVVAAACMIEEGFFFPGINDSKLLSLKKRLSLFQELTSHKAVIWAYSSVSHTVIDEINILQATRLAMKQAVEKLSFQPDCLLIDALTIDLDLFQEKIIQGDQKSQSIAAASIIAKTLRDEEMLRWHEVYPMYGFDQHKGYGTEQHLECLQIHGPCPIHRRSFAPVAQSLSRGHLFINDFPAFP